MISSYTKAVSKYVAEKGIVVKTMAENTGIPYQVLRNSLTLNNRELRLDEYVTICEYMNISPGTFFTDGG